MTSFRDARRIKPHREVTVTSRRVAVVVAVQALVVGGAFAGGYLLRGETPRTAAPARAAALDPLRQLDAEDKRVDYTYHQVLTQPREHATVAPVAEAAPERANATVPGTARAKSLPMLAKSRVRETRQRAVFVEAETPARIVLPRRAPLRVVAQRPTAEESADEGGSDEVRKLEERVRNLAASSVRTKAAKRAEAAQLASTDDELSEAMDPAGPGRARGED